MRIYIYIYVYIYIYMAVSRLLVFPTRTCASMHFSVCLHVFRYVCKYFAKFCSI